MIYLEELLDAIEENKPFEIKEYPYLISPVNARLNFIGDVHGAKAWYQEVCRKSEYSIQLGDIHNSIFMRYYFDNLDDTRHKYIHGNHDWINGKIASNYLGPFGVWTINKFNIKIGFISGAFSVDRAVRMYSNKDPLHENEELSVHLLQNAIDLIKEEQPDVIVTHTAPVDVLDKLILSPQFGRIRSKTSRALQSVLEECSPSLWIFGHFHQDNYFTYQNRVTFACVNMRTILPFF